jgi:hypothetical protein
MNKPKEVKSIYNKNINRETTENIWMVAKHSTLIDWRKNSCCENGCSGKINPQIELNPHLNPNIILHRNRKSNIKIYIDAQKTPMQCCTKRTLAVLTMLDLKLSHRIIVTKAV